MTNGNTSWIHAQMQSWDRPTQNDPWFGVGMGRVASPRRLMGPLARVPFMLLGGLCLAFLAGCASTVETERAVTLEEPRAKNAVILETDDPADLEKLAEAVDAIELSSSQEGQGEVSQEGGATAQSPGSPPARVPTTEALEMVAGGAVLPPDSAKLIALPKLSRTEIAEITEDLVLSLGSELNYAVAPSVIDDALPVPPDGLVGGRVLTRSAEDGAHVLRFGYRHFLSQPPKLWVMGVIIDPNGMFSVNPELAEVEPRVTKVIESLQQMRANLTVRDLEARLIQLSYVDAAVAMGLLKGFGLTTFDQAAVPPKIEFAQLPYVVSVKDPDSKYTGLVGAKTKAEAAGVKLSMAPGAAADLEDNTIASPLTQLLVLFHPAHPEQYSEVRRLLDTFIDRPARQIFIEAMVLEISEQGLKELGVEWQLHENPYLGVSGGSTTEAGAATSTLDATLANTSQIHQILSGRFQWDWEVTLRALLRSGKAEIMSRPSVLTLNNRQSTIRVGEDIPIASSLEGGYGGSKVGFKFEYLPTGILLNIRPRISESGGEVSMLVDTIVSAKVPGQDLEIRSTDNDVVLASAPTVSTRRVQTYGRIPNNTPLIIGGLVARENTQTRDKVPILGDIPMVGMLFRAEKVDRLKREVIIVLTPHVLPDDRRIRQALPKDEDHFDSFGNELFRDSYRIRSEDVFDLTFLLENKRIVTYRQLAREVAEKDFRLGETHPLRAFVRDRVPGESILVTRMIYEVVKRLDIAEAIESSRIIYFEGQQVGGYSVEFLEEFLKEKMGKSMKDFDGQAIAMTYRYDRASLEEGRLGSEPIPEIRVIECPDRKVWGEKLWELNQPMPDGQQRHTILIQNESDLVRLRRALALKRIATLNGGLEYMRLRNFSVGKVLLMPELKKGQIHVVDADTARFFFHTEHYYAATLARIEEDLKDLDSMLRRPDIRVLLDSELPDNASSDENK